MRCELIELRKRWKRNNLRTRNESKTGNNYRGISTAKIMVTIIDDRGSSLVVHWDRDLELSLQQPLLWCRFDSRPGNFHIPQAGQGKQTDTQNKQIKQ